MINFGSRLRALRISRGWTQEELADQLRLTKSVISAYETSLRYPSYDILIRICSIFRQGSDSPPAHSIFSPSLSASTICRTSISFFSLKPEMSSTLCF